MSKSTSDYVQFNGQNYMVKIRLVNEEVDLKIPAGIVRELIITDNIYSPFANAVLTLNNTFYRIRKMKISIDNNLF